MARQPKSNAGRKKQTDLYESYPSQKPRAVKPLATISAGKLIDIYPQTEPQRQMIESWASGLNICAVGSPGTGKSYVALFLALRELEEGNVKKIIIIRSAVAGRDVGHLPGSLEEKLAVYEAPYQDIVNNLMGSGSAYEVLKKKNVIEFMSSSYLRGLTISDAIIVFDEWQNEDYSAISTIISRIGVNTRIVMCGDMKQNDLFRKREKTGFDEALKVIERMPNHFDVVNFLPEDIVRSGICRAWILAAENV